MKRLPKDLLAALRAIGDAPGHSRRAISLGTLQALQFRELIQRDLRTADRYELTAKGRQALEWHRYEQGVLL